MQMRRVGRSGLQVSAIGLGCNNFGGRIGLEEARAVVHAALDAGITLFDTADVYGALGIGTRLELQGSLRGDPGGDPRPDAAGGGGRDQVRHGDGRERPARPVHPAATSCAPSRTACAD